MARSSVSIIPTMVLLLLTPLQNDSVKDGTRRYTASSNLKSRLGTTVNASITSSLVLRRGVRASRASMVFGAFRTRRTALRRRTSRVTRSSALGRMSSMLPSTVSAPRVKIHQSSPYLRDKANNPPGSLTVCTPRLRLGEYSIYCRHSLLTLSQRLYCPLVCRKQSLVAYRQGPALRGPHEGRSTHDSHSKPDYGVPRHKDRI